MNPPVTALELKKQLIAHGFEVYRTIGNRVLLAERVRDNLIMDSNVAAVAGESFAARASYRAQQVDFHAASEAELFAQARLVAADALKRGYREIDKTVVPIVDPGDRTRTLDTWYEITVELIVASLDDLVSELRYLVASPKVAKDARGATG
jgi:flagellar basal body rod protein FlgC